MRLCGAGAFLLLGGIWRKPGLALSFSQNTMKPDSIDPVFPVEDIVEPVTLTEVKKQIKMEGFDDDDAYLNLLIAASREKVEEYCKRSFVPQQFVLGFSQWPMFTRGWFSRGFYPFAYDDTLELVRPPVNSVDSVKYYQSSDSALVDLDAARYRVDTSVMPGVIRVNSALPSLDFKVANPVQVTITAGEWGEDNVNLPSRVKLAILLTAATFYENRVNVVIGTIATEVPDAAKALLGSLRIRNM